MSKIITPTQVLRESLRVLHNTCVFAKGANREYSKEFAVTGAKVGSVVNVRLPNRYYVTEGTALQAQDTNEQTTPVALTTNWQVGLNFSEADLLLSVDDFRERIITPAVSAESSKIDFRGLGQFVNIYNQVGIAGTTPGGTGGVAGSMTDASAPRIFLNAGALMTKFAAPKDRKRSVCLDPIAEANSVAGLSGLLNPSDSIGEQYREGVMGRALGFEFCSDQNINYLTTGNRAGTPVVNGANQTGSTIAVNGWTAGTTINAGEVISLAGVQSVNPENQQSTGLTAFFVVTANTTADANGNMAALPISPSINLIGPVNAYGTVTALPANGAAVTLLSGAANTTFPVNMSYHRDAFTLATADLLLPGGVDFAARENYDGISMRIVRQYDINSSNLPCRIDVLGGWATLRPELACRILG